MEGKEHKLTGDGFKKALSLFVEELNRYFNVSTDREKEEDTVDAIRKGVSAGSGVCLYCPVIVKYRDEKTSGSVTLEDLLR